MSQAPSRSFARSVAGLAIVRLVGLASGLAVAVIGARVLGESGYGAAGVAITLAMVVALLCNGGVNISVIYLAGRLRDRRAEILAATAGIALVGCIAAVVAVLALGAVLAPALKLPGRGDLFAAAALVAAGIIAFEYGGAALLAIGRERAYSGVELVRALAALGVTAAALAAWEADVAFVVAAGAGYVIGAGVALGVGQRATAALVPAWHADLVGRSLAIGMRGQVGNVLQFLNLRLDLVLIPILLQLPAAGLYLVSVRVSEVLTQLANAAGSLIFPTVAAQADQAATAVTERAVRVNVLVVTAAALALVVLADPLLGFAFGSAYRPGAQSLQILAIAMIPLSVTRILAGDLKGRGRPGLVSLAMLAAVIVTATLDLLLIPILGIAGAAVASLAAYALSAGLLLAAFRLLTGTRLRFMLPGWDDVSTLVRAARALLGAAR